MRNNVTKILLAGEGGQGIQTIAKIMVSAFANAEKSASYIPEFGPEQRGTPSVAFIQISDDVINYPRFDFADLAIVLRERALSHVSRYFGKQTEIVFDSSTLNRRLINQSNSKVFGMPATKLAEEKFGSKNLNLIVLSAVLNSFFQYPEQALWSLVEKQLASKLKTSSLKEKAKEAFEYGFNFKLEQNHYSNAQYGVKKEIIIKRNSERQAVIIPSQCKGCGICIENCPVKALSFGNTLGVYGTPTPDINIDKCIACGNCFKFCPDSAIRVIKK